MKESRKPQPKENLLMQLKINLDRDDLDKMCAHAVKEEGEKFVSPLFLLNMSWPLFFYLHNLLRRAIVTKDIKKINYRILIMFNSIFDFLKKSGISVFYFLAISSAIDPWEVFGVYWSFLRLLMAFW